MAKWGFPRPDGGYCGQEACYIRKRILKQLAYEGSHHNIGAGLVCVCVCEVQKWVSKVAKSSVQITLWRNIRPERILNALFGIRKWRKAASRIRSGLLERNIPPERNLDAVFHHFRSPKTASRLRSGCVEKVKFDKCLAEWAGAVGED